MVCTIHQTPTCTWWIHARRVRGHCGRMVYRNERRMYISKRVSSPGGRDSMKRHHAQQLCSCSRMRLNLKDIEYHKTHTWLSGRETSIPSSSNFSFTFENNQSLAAKPPTIKTDCNKVIIIRTVNAGRWSPTFIGFSAERFWSSMV